MKRVTGDVENYLSYGKLNRTGNLLRGIKYRVQDEGRQVKLYNNVRYAEEHQTGKSTGSYKTVKRPYTHNGADAVVLGGNVVARPFMTPSKKVLQAPHRLTLEYINRYGWNKI